MISGSAGAVPIHPISTALVVTPQRGATSRSEVTRRVQSLYRGLLEAHYLRTYAALHLGGKDTLESKVIRSLATSCPTHTEEEMAPRLANYKKISSTLKGLSQEKLALLLANASRLGHGIGGEVLLAEVEGVPVIIKKIALTALEQQHPRSTRNLFELPSYYQYGVGSMGFGVWRELAALEIASEWVRKGECQNFPLLYYSTVVERSSKPAPLTKKQKEEIQADVKYWNSSEAVRRRAEAVASASADVVVFMEALPGTLQKQFDSKAASDTGLSEQQLAKIELELTVATEFMKSRGFTHFDAHFGNVLASNDHVYFADFGLATSRDFDLSPEERAFFEKHIDYDRTLVVGQLVWHAMRASSAAKGNSDDLLKQAWNTYLSDGKIEISVPTAVEAIAVAHRPIVALWEDFLHGIQDHDKSHPYPAAALREKLK